MLLLLLKAKRYWREGAIGVLVVGLSFAVISGMRDRRELERARLVYENPQVKVVEKVVKVQGPVRVVTKIVEKPGETITIVKEVRGEVFESTGSETESKPVPLSVSMARPRTDRWLVAAQAGRDEEYTVLAGYGFRNRLDLLAGGGTEGLRIQAVVRF